MKSMPAPSCAVCEGPIDNGRCSCLDGAQSYERPRFIASLTKSERDDMEYEVEKLAEEFVDFAFVSNNPRHCITCRKVLAPLGNLQRYYSRRQCSNCKEHRRNWRSFCYACGLDRCGTICEKKRLISFEEMLSRAKVSARAIAEQRLLRRRARGR